MIVYMSQHTSLPISVPMPGIDISNLKTEVNNIIENHINTVVSQLLSDCNTFKETHDYICNLPFVKQIYFDNNILNNKIDVLVKENLEFKEKILKLSQTSIMSQLQAAICERNDVIMKLTQDLEDIKQTINNESIKLEINEINIVSETNEVKKKIEDEIMTDDEEEEDDDEEEE